MDYSDIPFPQLSLDVWWDKYRIEGEDYVYETLLRVHDTVFLNGELSYDPLINLHFIPGGRILNAIGSGRNTTAMNCFVMDTINDDMQSILNVYNESMMTMKHGGGIGMDFSTLRPKGDLLSTNENTFASGPISFMQMWDTGCKTIMSAGSRRGAMMACLRVDHPDIKEFITSKTIKNNLTQFNISVLITDHFMHCVTHNQMFELRFNNKIYETVNARELFDLIMKTTYDYAEPGVLFIDTANRTNKNNNIETFYATNPCGEQYLPPNGSCNLGAINLPALIIDPFTPHAAIDENKLCNAITYGITFLNRVIDLTTYPLEKQKLEMLKKRRIGLGLMGVGSAAAMLGIDYSDIPEDETFNSIMKIFQRVSQKTAEELNSNNVMLTTIAPTGNTGVFAKNVSGGIEPIFDYEYTRSVLQADGSKINYTTRDASYELTKEIFQTIIPENIENYFRRNKATNISPQSHLKVQAFFQSFIDNSISKTINCPANMTFNDFKDIYMNAYKLGCKGCTTYRPSQICLDTRGAVLSEIKSESVVVDNNITNASIITPLERPRIVSGKTYKIKWGPDEASYYITLNEYNKKPFEIFINSSCARAQAELAALTRMVSAIWRLSDKYNTKFLIEELNKIHSSSGGFVEGKYYPSLPAVVGSIIEEYTKGLEGTLIAEQTNNIITLFAPCPKCGQFTLRKSEGCDSCSNCGYSKCG